MRITAMAFRTTREEFDFLPGDVVDLAVTLEANEFRGERDVTLIVKNVKFSALPNETVLQAQRLVEQARRREAFTPEQAAALLPQREEGAKVYRVLQKYRTVPLPVERILLEAGMMEAGAEEFARVWLAAEVLKELGVAGSDGAGRYVLAPPGEKMEWENAGLVRFLKTPPVTS